MIHLRVKRVNDKWYKCTRQSLHCRQYAVSLPKHYIPLQIRMNVEWCVFLLRQVMWLSVRMIEDMMRECRCVLAIYTGIYCGYRACEYIGVSTRERLVLTSSILINFRKTYYYRDHYLDPSKCGVCALIMIASLLRGIPFYPLVISLVKWYSRPK